MQWSTFQYDTTNWILVSFLPDT